MILISFMLLFVTLCKSYSVDEIRKTFGSRICVEGSLSNMDLLGKNTFLIKESKGEDARFGNFSVLIPDKSDASSLTQLNELAQYNELKYFFKLEREDGPAHQKTFFVSLTLGDEKYESEGKSLKKAKQNAAAAALANTEYESPHVKDKSGNEDALTPTVLLNNLSAKLGIAVSYTLMDKDKQMIMKSNVVVDEKSKKSYIQKLNESVYSSKSIHIKKDLGQIKGPFNVKVQAGEHVFYGTAHTIQSAKHEAASNALDFFIKNKDNKDLDLACLKEGSEDKCKEAKQNIKSPISLIYEAGQARNLGVEFEIINESGPAHKKIFVTECRLGDLTTIGEGKSKKESKRVAAEKMLERVPELAPISQEMQVKGMLKDKKKKKKNKKNKIIKTKFDEISMTMDNIVDSVLGFGKSKSNDGNRIDDTSETLDESKSSKSKKSKKTSKKSKQSKQSHQDELLELSNFLNFEAQYLDFSEKNHYYSLLSLHINPEHICFGDGFSEKDARNKAAGGGLNLLYNLGFYDHFEDPRLPSVEREVKEVVRTVLKQDISEEKN